MMGIEIPMYADDDEALQDLKRKRNEHWNRMRNARTYWMTEHKLRSLDDNFWLWLKKDYGIIPRRDTEGNITGDLDIINEKLYVLFLLKFGQ